MLRFRLGPIPVEVHPSLLLFAVVLGLMQVSNPDPASWPGRQVALGDAAAGLAKAAALVIWVSIIFVSVLIHELGHALVSLAFRYRPTIQLAGLGGVTSSRAPGPIPWHRDVLITLTGPLVGAGFGALCLLGARRLGAGSDIARYGLEAAAAANIVWAIFNLLPVLPLDGGRITSAILTRAFGKVGLAAAQVLALVVCVAGVSYGLLRGAFLMLALFAMFGVQAARALVALWQGDGSQEKSDDLTQADALFRAGQLDRARERAEAVAAGDPSPAVRSRAHHLLGWIALKQGEGRRALDHFSQVQRRPVEKQALAAAFSLLGDDGRALPLWREAWESTRNATVLHEWAGALIRAGQLDQASRLPGVDLGKAYACAERVAFLRGEFHRAAELGLSALDRHPSAEAAYDVACALARAGEADRAVLLLERARDLGFADAPYARTDADLASLHGHPGFERWLAAVGKSASA